MDPKRSKALTFTMLGHAHLDPVWLWDRQEGIETVKATFRSALDRMQEHPDLVFAHSSAGQYAWMEIHPELMAEIRAAVARGQWEPVGGFWVEPDLNIPSGEALARQGLYGQRYFERVLGRRCRVGFLPDSFGHPYTMPQILKQCGLEYFLFWRPLHGEIDLPSNLFWWQGPDGTRILSARIETYNSNPNQAADTLNAAMDWRPDDAPEWIVVYGVGNHGGGPTIKAIRSVRELQEHPDWPTIRMGAAEGFFDRATDRERPTFTAPLQYTFRGCYTSHSQIKQLNRAGEQALQTAEKWSVVAARFGRPYPNEGLERSWRHVLFNQFHDVICGTSIASAYEDARHELGEAIGFGRRTQHEAMMVIAQQIDTRSGEHSVTEAMRRVRTGAGNAVADLGDGLPVVVFNPSPWRREAVIDVEVNDWHPPIMQVLDDQNRPVPHQFGKPEAFPPRKRAVFLADVPPLGYRVYRLVDRPPALFGADAPPLTTAGLPAPDYAPAVHQALLVAAPGAPAAGDQPPEVAIGGEPPVPAAPATGQPPATAPAARPTPSHPPLPVLENRWWRLELDPRTGALRSLKDRERNLELLAGAGAQLLVIDDPTSPWGSGDSFRHLVGVFGEPEMELLEDGPVRATWSVTTRYGRSTARQEISIYREIAAIHGRMEIDWRDEWQFVKLAFPFALQEAAATFSVPFGHIERPAAGQEEPTQQWLDVTGRIGGQPYGFALLNDCKYGADVLGGEARLSILRSPVHGSGNRYRTPWRPGDRFLDQGLQTVRWALVPHAGPWQDAGIVAAAQDFNEPLAFVREYAHPGALPRVHSFAEIAPPGQLMLTALKQAEDSADWIIRCYEPHGREAAATLRLTDLNLTVPLRAGPHQIKTYRISPGGQVREVNFLEE